METLEVGMYVRDEKGHIGKIINKKNDLLEIDNGLITYGTFHPEILKASHNIIDLIEEKDIILFRLHGDLYKKEVENISSFNHFMLGISMNIGDQERLFELKELNILKILTKEQFENNCYKVGD